MGHPDNVLLLPLSLLEEASCLVVSNSELSGGSGVYDSLFPDRARSRLEGGFGDLYE